MKQRIQFNTAGVTFENRQGLLAHIRNKPDVQITLFREPTNQFDPNAIKVLGSTGTKKFHLGYVPRELAADLAPKMDNRSYIKVENFRVTGNYKTHYGLRLEASY